LTLTAIILAGGQSRRMGVDKARLVWEGAPLLERVCSVTLSVSLPVWVIGRQRPADWPTKLEAVSFAEDNARGYGPLGGLQTALKLEDGPALMLACDLPLLSSEGLRWLIAEVQSARTGAHGLVTMRDGRWEPLFSYYTPACLPLIETQIAQGRLSLRALIEAGDFGQVEVPDWLAGQLVNVNTPEEFRELG